MKTLYTLVDKIRFKTVFCDVMLRPHCYDRASVAFCLSHATVLKVSAEEPLLREFSSYVPKEETPRAIANELRVDNKSVQNDKCRGGMS